MLLLYAISRRTGRNPFWHWVPSKVCGCPFELLFETEIGILREPLPEQGRLITQGEIPGNEVIELAKQRHSDPVLILADRYYGHNYDSLDLVVRPASEVLARISQFASSMHYPRMYGVHVRHGDKGVLGPPPLPLYFQSADKLLDSAHDAGIFLASDDLEVITAFGRRYGRRAVSYPARTLRRDCPEGIVDAVVILYLLRASLGVIGCNFSGYSLCAGWSCGFHNVPAAISNNHTWAGDAFSLPSIRGLE